MRLLVTAAAFSCALVALPASATANSGKPFDFEMAPRGAVAQRLATNALQPGRDAVARLGEARDRDSRAALATRVEQVEELHARGHASDPLWVGEADAVQYRLSKRVPGLRLHFVNVGRYAHARARTAQAAQPGFVSRAAWGASQCPPRQKPLYGTVKAVIVHHTVSLNDYTPEEAPAIVLAICRYHRNSNGWNDIGYNALVDKYGVLYEGRAGGLDRAVVGAQAQGFNSETAGIASIADHTRSRRRRKRSTRWRATSAGSWRVHLQPLSGKVTLTSAGGSESRYGAGARVTVDRVLGHRDVGRTACPGNLLYPQLDQLRAMVATGIGAAPSFAAHVSAALAHYTIDYGEAVPVTGLLSGPDGLALPGAAVEVQTNADGRWVTSENLTTAADGTFAGELRPRKRMYVRLRFPGQPSVRRSDVGAAAAAAAAGDRAAPAGQPRAARRARGGLRSRGAAQARGLPRAPAARARPLPNGGHARRAGPGGPLRVLVRPGLPGALPLRGGGEVGRGHGPGLDRLARCLRVR